MSTPNPNNLFSFQKRKNIASKSGTDQNRRRRINALAKLKPTLRPDAFSKAMSTLLEGQETCSEDVPKSYSVSEDDSIVAAVKLFIRQNCRRHQNTLASEQMLKSNSESCHRFPSSVNSSLNFTVNSSASSSGTMKVDMNENDGKMNKNIEEMLRNMHRMDLEES